MSKLSRAAAVAGIGLASWLVGCDTSVPATVLVLGDSLSVQAADDYSRTMVRRDRGYLPMINAIVGAGLCPARTFNGDGYWQPRIAALLEKVDPGVVVVELGTNDAFSEDADCQAQYGDKIDSFMQALGDHHVMWENLNTERVGPGGPTINAALADATSRWPNLQVLDFNGHFAGHPEWYPSNGDVHPNDSGQAEEAQWLTGQLDSYIASTTTTTTTTTTSPGAGP